MNQTTKKNIYTHGLALVFLFIVYLLVFYPAFLQSKKLDQYDITQHRGMAQQVQDFRERKDAEPKWTNSMFSGMPAEMVSLNYSGDLFKTISRFFAGIFPQFQILFAMIGFYILLISFRVRPLIACFGAVAFGLCGFNIIGLDAGHNSKIGSVAFMPFVLASIHLAYSKDRRWLGIGFAGFFTALMVSAGHYQIVYYFLFVLLSYIVYQFIRVKKQKEAKRFFVTSSFLLVMALIAYGANYGRIHGASEYSKHTIRGESVLENTNKPKKGLSKEYAFQYSNGILEPLTLFVPNILGGASSQALSSKSNVAAVLKNGGLRGQKLDDQLKNMPTYWGDQPLTSPYYAGAIPIFLFVLALFLLPRRHTIWIVSFIVLGIVLSWGKNFSTFNYLLFDTLPGMNKFRSVTIAICISVLGINLLAFLSLDKIFKMQWDKTTQKKLLHSTLISGGFLLLLIVFSGLLSYKGVIDERLPDWLLEPLRSDRKSLLVKDALSTLFFVLSTSAIIWFAKSGRLKVSHALLVIGGLVFINSFLLSKRFINQDSFVEDPVKSFYKPQPADDYISSLKKSGDRVLNITNPFNDARVAYFHESVGGYHPAKLRRYQDLIEWRIGTETQQVIEKIKSQSSDFSEMGVLNMLNTRFFYFGPQKEQIIVNTFANGNAWIVSDVVSVDSPDNEIVMLKNIDTKRQVTLDVSEYPQPSFQGSGSINLIHRDLNKISYEANIVGGEALAVFSEIFYPEGWEAFVDGEEVEIWRVNYLLRALKLSEGNHKIEFAYDPPQYYRYNTIMLIFSSLCIFLFIGGIVYTVYQGNVKNKLVE